VTDVTRVIMGDSEIIGIT